jgi:hypothetical protein
MRITRPFFTIITATRNAAAVLPFGIPVPHSALFIRSTGYDYHFL